MSIPADLRVALLEKAEQTLPLEIKWRRHLHQYPELSLEEFKTTAFLKKQVRQMGLRILPIKLKTGVLAELKGNHPGKTIAIRADIDALPVTEMTGLSFKSRKEGYMHACGHDAHMAVALGTASMLTKFKDRLHGAVRFIFQPAEEMPPGGARPMIASGALKNVSMIFALHVNPQVSLGKIGLRDGASMGSVIDFNLIIHGRGGHAARPHTSVDAIVVAAEVIDSLQKVVSREIDPIDPAVISFGTIEGGAARNTVCDLVKLNGTARALTPVTAGRLKRLIRRTVTNICRARGARVEMNLIADYPVLVNHPQANRILADNFSSLFSKRNIVEAEPVLGGEDFACYLEKTRGALFWLGVQNKKIKADQPWHSPRFMIDEKAMFYGTSLMTASVLDYLKGNDK
ncbi:MAG: amidohydrolase [Candidatus Zixiibacteriota bacterium]|nr:MAG: amidohydrolase [candidate division Zixibacteria bacterium]